MNKHLQLKLKDHEKVILKRYIENELHQPDFLSVEGHQQIYDEVLLFVYFAGHGCADTNQIFVVNESNLDKVFWNAEEKLTKLAERCGNALKQIVVFDVCREPISKTKKSIKNARDKREESEQ